MLPSVDNGGVVNRMCKKLEEEFNNILPPVKEGNFDKSILMTNKKVKNSICDELRELYKQYKSDIQSFMKSNKNSSKEDIQSNRSVFVSNFIEKAELICDGDYEILTNSLVEMLYTNPVSKQFVWDICGNYIIDLLLKNNNYYISYPIEDVNGNIEWNGNRYSLYKDNIGGVIC